MDIEMETAEISLRRLSLRHPQGLLDLAWETRNDIYQYLLEFSLNSSNDRTFADFSNTCAQIRDEMDMLYLRKQQHMIIGKSQHTFNKSIFIHRYNEMFCRPSHYYFEDVCLWITYPNALWKDGKREFSDNELFEGQMTISENHLRQCNNLKRLRLEIQSSTSYCEDCFVRKWPHHQWVFLQLERFTILAMEKDIHLEIAWVDPRMTYCQEVYSGPMDPVVNKLQANWKNIQDERGGKGESSLLSSTQQFRFQANPLADAADTEACVDFTSEAPGRKMVVTEERRRFNPFDCKRGHDEWEKRSKNRHTYDPCCSSFW